MYPSIARKEYDDIDGVPDDGEAERNDHPGQEDGEAVIEIGISIVPDIVPGIVIVVAVVLDGYGPGYSADGYSGEEDGKDAEEEFPEVGRVVCVYCGS